MLAVARGSLSLCGYVANTLVLAPLVMLIGVFKLLPVKPLQQACSKLLDTIATLWISINNQLQDRLCPTEVITNDLPKLSTEQWYLVIANHQSWVDILVLQRVFNKRIPFLKFFLKHELIYVPFLGLAWWALDFPFMRRYSASQLKKNPQLKGKDQEATRQACEKFQYKPVSIVNFVEGTRFTQSKHQQQGSPYTRLLKPKSGGIAMSLDAMAGKLGTLVDVTIYYPDGVPTFWQYLCGEVPKVELMVETHCLEAQNAMSFEKREDRSKFQTWLNRIWSQKDGKLAALKNGHSPQAQ